ncbi:MAG TPA: TlpA disulfide reductase family protein [Chryseolinea sp.]|nr:TlpA disulfide reductase family protein [Chryseolinea sp.]
MSQKMVTAWKKIRPWVTILVVFLVLRYTGAISGISYLTGSLLIRSGAMNASVDTSAPAKSFNYNFKIKDLQGKVIDFKTFKGKTIFLNIWATWCGPCRIEMPSIQKLYDQVDKDKIVFVMLSIDRGDSFEKVVTFVNEKEYTFPVYVPKGYLTDQLQVRTIPTTFVISPEGKIVSQEAGAANYDTEEFKNFLGGLVK